MLDNSRLTDDQRDHLAVLQREWRVLAPLLREDAEYAGGMTFKAVSGADYLVRYFTDPETGKKVFRSKGRRSKTTERELETWLTARDRHKTELATASGRMELQCRIAKAHRLARVPVRSAELIRPLWLAGLFDDGVAVCGLSSIYAFELEAGELAAPRLLRDDEAPDLELVSARDPERWRDAIRVALREPSLRERAVDDALELSDDAGHRILVRRWEDFDRETDVMRVLAIARDSTPIEIPSVYPDIWLQIVQERGGLRLLDRDQGQFVEGLLERLEHVLGLSENWFARRGEGVRL